MKCSNCGRDIPNDSIYCEFCGVQVKFSDALHKKSKRTLWIILSVVLAVVIAVVAFAIIQEQQECQAVIAWEQQQAAQKQQELEQQLEAERQAELLKYVDLGLPSGTCWRNSNEGGDYTRYTYDEAINRFGNQLPTKYQLEELKNKCTWTWIGNGYKVTGPNGNSIYLPAAGYRGCGDGVYSVGTRGDYWSSTPYDSDNAWSLYFYSSEVYVNLSGLCYGNSVRLVQ